MKGLLTRGRATVAVLTLALASLASLAQTTPPTVDWAASTASVVDGLQTQVVAMLPIVLAFFGIMVGIGLVKMLIKRFSKG